MTEILSERPQSDKEADRREKKREYQSAYYAANRERVLARHRAYNAANKERNREYLRSWKAANKDRVREHARRAYRTANPERKRNPPDPDRRREQTRAYYAANRERLLEAARVDRAANKKKYRAYYLTYRERALRLQKIRDQRRRARKAQVESTFTAADWRILVAQSKRCHWCRKPFTKNRRPTHDHVVPISRGGADTLENSVCACRECNVRKHARLLNPATGQGILL